jgi:hypothetical protein
MKHTEPDADERGGASDMDDDDLHLVHRAFRRTVKHGTKGGMTHESDLGPNNPAVSARQQRFMGADYARAKKGEPTRTGMSKSQLHDFAKKPAGGY